MGALITLALLVLPIAEIWTLIVIGSHIGPGWTVLWLFGDVVVGMWLIRREGRRAWSTLQNSLRRGGVRNASGVSQEVLNRALILLGAVLLILPGFITDIPGWLLVLPFTRAPIRAAISRRAGRRSQSIRPRVIEQDGSWD